MGHPGIAVLELHGALVGVPVLGPLTGLETGGPSFVKPDSIRKGFAQQYARIVSLDLM